VCLWCSGVFYPCVCGVQVFFTCVSVVFRCFFTRVSVVFRCFFTCVSAEDHMAEVQVCESLAECYLRQRKQQKAVQLYKQALSALVHCKVGTYRIFSNRIYSAEYCKKSHIRYSWNE